MARVGWMLGPSHYRRGTRPAPSGCFGAAAAAGYLWRLDPGSARAALGLAGAQAGGVWEGISREAVMVKHFHGGRAAAAGLLAGLSGADWLSRGRHRARRRTGPGRGGVPDPTAGDTQTAMASLGSEFMVQRNFFKRYPCCLGNFQGLDAVRVAGQPVATIAADDVER